MDTKALQETAKTIARGVWFSLLGLLALILTVLSTSQELAQATITLPVFNITLSVGALIVAGVASLAKVIDRYVHESRSTKINGLAPTFLQK